MKTLKHIFISIFAFTLLLSCSSVHVKTDYDTQTDFTKYKTFAFYKKGIDQSKISDLDKRRILRAIEKELIAKGLTKSKNPDLLVSIFAKAEKRINVYNNDYWYPHYYTPYYRNNVSQYVQGTLFVDLIDAEKKQLIWQGVGKGALSTSSKPEKKEARIQKIVAEILAKYPPTKE
jgi:hypothetical protein